MYGFKLSVICHLRLCRVMTPPKADMLQMWADIPTACRGDVMTTFHMTCDLPAVISQNVATPFHETSRYAAICCEILPNVAGCRAVTVSHGHFI